MLEEATTWGQVMAQPKRLSSCESATQDDPESGAGHIGELGTKGSAMGLGGPSLQVPGC